MFAVADATHFWQRNNSVMTDYKKSTVTIGSAWRRQCWPKKGLMLQLLICSFGFVSLLLFTIPVQAHSDPTPNIPANSLAFEGLIPDKTLCGDGYRIAGTNLCTHGPDSPMLGLANPEPALGTAEQPLTPGSILCDGDGISGKRVQLMYVRAEDRPDRYAQSLAEIRTRSVETDKIFDVSAQETGGHRHIRFVTDAQCQLDVLNVVIPSAADDTFRATILAVNAQGYDSRDRKYIMFVDADVYCGMATVLSDTKPTADNSNNILTGYARMDNTCWDNWAVAHELVHLLGGVQFSAPILPAGGIAPINLT
ncbi:hypothetical protein BH10CHL1_BH10CHL1_36410 [soil metagenome]